MAYVLVDRHDLTFRQTSRTLLRQNADLQKGSVRRPAKADVRPGQFIIIGGAACRPGASHGSQMMATARPSVATPATRPASAPHLQVFSTSTTAARPIMAAMFITPTAIRITIRPQQQPRQ